MNIISYEKRALRVFAKNCREVFEVGVWEPSNGREPEMSRLVPITDTLLHTAPTYLWKHRNILTSDSLPLAANFYICCQHLPLNAATAAAILFSFQLFSFDFWEVAAPFLGQLAHFMNHNTLYRLPPLHCCQPIWGCATAGGGGLGGGVGGGDNGGGDRLDENKKWKRAMVVLIPWHWLVGCISIFLLFASFCCDM